jgi:hypothetical protein
MMTVVIDGVITAIAAATAAGRGKSTYNDHNGTDTGKHPY